MSAQTESERSPAGVRADSWADAHLVDWSEFWRREKVPWKFERFGHLDAAEGCEVRCVSPLGEAIVRVTVGSDGRIAATAITATVAQMGTLSQVLARLPISKVEAFAYGDLFFGLQQVTEHEVDLRLRIPRHRPYGDGFYLHVALVYIMAAAEFRGPAAAIAEVNRVPVSSVHSWVKEARRRGFLSAGRRGRVG